MMQIERPDLLHVSALEDRVPDGFRVIELRDLAPAQRNDRAFPSRRTPR
jgi:hypothetical protein